MKKVLAIVLIMLIVFSFSGCSLIQSIFDTSTEDSEDVTQSLAENLFETGLGLGVNALTKSSAVGTTRLPSIFKEGALDKTNVGSYKVGSTRSTAMSSEEISSIVSSYNEKLDFGSKTEVGYAGMFTLGFETKYSIEESIDSSLKQNQFYYRVNHYYNSVNYQIKDYQITENFESKLSNYFISDLEKVENEAMTPQDFFERYGTHLVMAVSYGGMLEFYHSTFSSEKINTIKLSEALSTDFSASLSYGLGSASAGVETSINYSSMEEVTSGRNESHFYCEAIGGDPSKLFIARSFSDLNSSYSAWVGSLSNEKYHCIIDVADGGLMPIWEYIPGEYSDATAILKDYFEQKAQENADTLAAKMQPGEFVDYGDTVNFAGGHGTEESPYLISTAEHFKNISKHLKGHFKLLNDIDLGSSWTPIGDSEWTELTSPSNPFKGHFDGNGKEIKYGISHYSWSNAKTYSYGLFGTIQDATIENLNVDVYMDLIKSGNGTSATGCYAGGIAGWAKNSHFENCTVEGKIYQVNSGDEGHGVIRTGGIVGKAYNTYFKGNVNKAELYSEGFNAFAGGICGGAKNYVDGGDNYNTGKLDASYGSWWNGHRGANSIKVDVSYKECSNAGIHVCGYINENTNE